MGWCYSRNFGFDACIYFPYENQCPYFKLYQEYLCSLSEVPLTIAELGAVSLNVILAKFLGISLAIFKKSFVDVGRNSCLLMAQHRQIYTMGTTNLISNNWPSVHNKYSKMMSTFSVCCAIFVVSPGWPLRKQTKMVLAEVSQHAN